MAIEIIFRVTAFRSKKAWIGVVFITIGLVFEEKPRNCLSVLKRQLNAVNQAKDKDCKDLGLHHSTDREVDHRPRMSFTVVMKGPVARAGSILYLFKTSGMKVPNKPAKRMTQSSAMLTVMLMFMDSLKIRLYTRMMMEQTKPFTKATINSFFNFGKISKLKKDSLAKP